MPLLFRNTSLRPATAALISALVLRGGVAAVLFGLQMDRFNANLVFAAGLALAALADWGHGPGEQHGRAADTGGAGRGHPEEHGVVLAPALVAAFYPGADRATEVGWMLRLGRFGGIAGSVLVAGCARCSLASGEILTFLTVPGPVAAVALLIEQLA